MNVLVLSKTVDRYTDSCLCHYVAWKIILVYEESILKWILGKRRNILYEMVRRSAYFLYNFQRIFAFIAVFIHVLFLA